LTESLETSSEYALFANFKISGYRRPIEPLRVVELLNRHVDLLLFHAPVGHLSFAALVNSRLRIVVERVSEGRHWQVIPRELTKRLNQTAGAVYRTRWILIERLPSS
jgi:hypothetical protein